MSTPENTENLNEEVQELADENLEEVSGGAATVTSVLSPAITDAAFADAGSTGSFLSDGRVHLGYTPTQ